MTAWSFSQSTVRTDTTSSQRDSAEVPIKRSQALHISSWITTSINCMDFQSWLEF